MQSRPVSPAERDRAEGRIPVWRRARRVALLAALACLVPVAISWLGAMNRPRNIGLGVASVEWLRANGGNTL